MQALAETFGLGRTASLGHPPLLKPPITTDPPSSMSAKGGTRVAQRFLGAEGATEAFASDLPHTAGIVRTPPPLPFEWPFLLHGGPAVGSEQRGEGGLEEFLPPERTAVDFAQPYKPIHAEQLVARDRKD